MPADRAATAATRSSWTSDWDTPRGTVRVIDFMPPRDRAAPQLVRIVEGVGGRGRRCARRCGMRFSITAWVVPWVRHGRPVHGWRSAGPDAVWLRTEPDVETYGQGF
ncbi:Glucoamylase OS=Streptomyces paromomycinus OX=92743 GN=GKJPGBOP_06604 PE=4 SV=1 [Streptomyces rimosus subsp. rimosus]